MKSPPQWCQFGTTFPKYSVDGLPALYSGLASTFAPEKNHSKRIGLSSGSSQRSASRPRRGSPELSSRCFIVYPKGSCLFSFDC